MTTEYLRTAKHSYMILKDAEYESENYELQMILNNDISSLLQMQVIVGDGAVEYWYEVTGMQTLEKQFSIMPVGEESLRVLLQNICDMKQQMEEYLLDDRNIDFSIRNTFWDRAQNRVHFCYIPGLGTQHNSGICGLLEEILPYIDHNDSWAVRVGYDLYETCVETEFTVAICRKCMNQKNTDPYLSKQPGEQDPEKKILLEKLWDNVDSEDEETEKKAISYGTENFRTGQIQTFFSGDGKKKSPINKKRRKRKIRTKPAENYKIPREYEIPTKKEYVAEPGPDWGQTVCFSQGGMKKVWMLEYRSDGLEKDFYIEKFPFRIGKDRERVDGELFADTVSRMQAEITCQEDVLYLEDFNSTNGTYLNGKMIPMNTPMELKEGDQIIFATEEYVLRKNMRFDRSIVREERNEQGKETYFSGPLSQR